LCNYYCDDCSETADGSSEDFDDLEFGCEVELDQSGDDAAMSYEDDP